MELNKKLNGKEIEEEALTHLIAKGYRLLGRNIRYRVGEIDLVLEKNQLLLFVEVRGRKAGGAQGWARTLSWKKLKRLKRAIQTYLVYYRGDAKEIRLDLWAKEGSTWVQIQNVELD